MQGCTEQDAQNRTLGEGLTFMVLDRSVPVQRRCMREGWEVTDDWIETVIGIARQLACTFA